VERQSSVDQGGDINIESGSQANSRHRKHQFKFTLEDGFYATMGGFAIAFPPADDGTERRATLTVENIRSLLENEPDFTLPKLQVPLTSITDRSKSSSLGKALLFVQVAWFCLNCASRLAQRLPLSLLEVSTLAHGVCTLASYAVWWSKPLNIDEPTLIDVQSQEYRGIEPAAKVRTRDIVMSVFENFNDPKGVSDDAVVFLVVAGIPIIYGALHFLGWHAQFPTTTERLLWRIGAVGVASPGAGFIIFGFPLIALPDAVHSSKLKIAIKSFGTVLILLLLALPLVYMLCSIYLYVESIRQLWYLAPEAYVVASWSYYFPHLF